MNCRHCGRALAHTFLDLGFAPPSNAYLTEADLSRPEQTYPLRLLVCDNCWLVQTEDYAAADELFRPDYAYFSSVSESFLRHANDYTQRISAQLGLGPSSFVVEIASNDGYLLRNFVAAGVPCLGIEPTASTAAAAEAIGIPVLREFFGETLARSLAAKGPRPNLIIGNNVLAHVPNINDFSAGMKVLLADGGTITLEFPHLMRLLEDAQFDTVYHEHYSYLSLSTVQAIFAAQALRVFDVEELPVHGGSLRVHGCHDGDPRPTARAVAAIAAAEDSRGMRDLAVYAAFQARADRIKDDLVAFLIEEKRQGRRVGAYGAAAKGNTLLNYAGLRPDLVPYVCDAAPSKQGKYLPGSHIPILPPAALRERRPETLLILPWNIAGEVMEQTSFIRGWGGRFAIAVPQLRLA